MEAVLDQVRTEETRGTVQSTQGIRTRVERMIMNCYQGYLSSFGQSVTVAICEIAVNALGHGEDNQVRVDPWRDGNSLVVDIFAPSHRVHAEKISAVIEFERLKKERKIEPTLEEMLADRCRGIGIAVRSTRQITLEDGRMRLVF